nr:copia protein [Tanacetum cinerariifolium]
MTTLANKAILSGADNRPSMLEKDKYDSWKCIMELYMMNRQHGRMIIESIENGPLIWPTIEENGVTRPRKYYELSLMNAIQADCDVKPTNIILQGQHEFHANEVCLMHERNSDLLALVATHQMTQVTLRITKGQATQTVIINNVAYQANDLDAYDSDCDELNTAKVALMANFSRYGSDVITKKAQQLKPNLYDGNVIKNTSVIVIPDSAETLMLAEESRLKMLLKQQDRMVLEKKVNTTPVDYAEKGLIIAALKVELRKLKGKALVDNVVITHAIDPEMLKTNCLGNNNSGDKLVAVTLKNKDKRVRFTEPVTSSRNTNIKTDSSSNLVSNKPMLSSTGVKLSTSASGSQPSGNTKKDKIQITTATEVPLRKPTALETDTPKPVVTLVYSRKPRKSKTNNPISKPKVIKSISANNKEPNKSWGSTVFDVPSSSLDECRSSNLFSGTVKFRNGHMEKIMGYGDYHIGNVTISKVYYMEGVGHNIFFVGQFFESNLEVAFCQHTCFIHNLEGLKDLEPALHKMTPFTSSSGFIPNAVSQQPCIPSKRDDWDHLFQTMFDEYFNPPTIVVSSVPVAVAPRDVDLADSPVSTSIDQDASSTSIPSTQEQEHSLNISQGFEESPKTQHFHDDPLHESLHKDSTSQGSSSNVRPIHTTFESLGRWTKDHPIVNVIRDPSRSVENRIMELYFVRTNYQLANIFTKPLPRERFNLLIEKLGMRSMSPKTLKHLTEEEDKVVEGVLQSVAPTTAEQKLTRKNELKAREKRFRGNTETKKVQKTLLKQQYENLTGTTSQNPAFMSSSNTNSTTKSVSAAASVSVVCAKMHVSSLPNVDSLSNAVIYSFFASQSSSPQLDNENLKQIDVDDLKEMDLRWLMAMLTMRARRFLQKTRRNLGANEPTSMGFDMSKLECYNCHRNGYFARECRSPKDSRRNGAAESQRRIVPVKTSTSNALVSQCDGVGSFDWSYQAEEEPTNYALMDFSSSSFSSDNEVFTRAMFDCNDYLSSESDESWSPSSLYDRFQLSDGYHDVPPPYTGTFMPPKPDLVFNTAPTAVETNHPAFNHVEISIPTATPKPATPKPTSSVKIRNRKACVVCKSLDHLIKDCAYHAKKMAQPTPRNHAHRGNHKQYAPLTHTNPQKHMVPASVLTQSKPISITADRPVSAAVPKIQVTRPRHAKPVVTKFNSPIRRHLTCSPSLKSSNSPPRVTAVKALVGNPQHALKDKGVIDSGCSRVVRFLEKEKSGQNRVLVTKPHNKTPYELLHGRTPSIGFIRPFGCPVTILNTLDSVGTGLTWLFDIDSLTRTMNYQPVTAGNQTNPSAGFQDKFTAEKAGKEIDQQYVLFPVCSAQSRKQDDETKKVAKGKSPVEFFTGYRNLSAEFEDCSDNSINEVNAAELEDITYSDDEDDEELLQFKMQKVWILVDFPHGKRAIGTKWGFRNKKDEIGIVVMNKARLVAQGHTQEEGIDYEDVFALVARIEAIRLFLAYSSFMGFMVYQMDVKSAFLYRAVEEEVYVCQPLGFEDPDHPNKVYKVVKALYGLHQAPRACHDKYVAEILRKFGLTEGKSASAPINTEMPLLKDFDGEDIDMHTYRLMIGSLKYLTSSRPDIMFVDSPFDLVAYSNSDYAGASLDRKSTIGGCQFLGCKLISWQCKKQTVVATSSTEAEYVAAASCCIQVLWIHN